MKRRSVAVDPEPKKQKEVLCNGIAYIDPECKEKLDTGHIYIENGDIYDVMLNQTNLGMNNNKFYLMQLIEDNKSKSYSIWFRWGRVGSTGQSKLVPYGSNLEVAKGSFCSKFHDKTKNHWSDRKYFVKFDGKYDVVQIQYADSKENQNPKAPSTVQPSKLDPRVKEIMELICNINDLDLDMKKLNYDSTRLPLGKLSLEQVNKGFSSMKEISIIVERIESLKKPKASNKRSAKNSASEITTLRRELIKITSEYYTRIPHDFGMQTPPILDNLDAVKDEFKLLEVLRNIQYTISVVEEKKSSVLKKNPLDLCYDEMKCVVCPLDQGSEEYRILCEYFESTKGATHDRTYKIAEIFSLKKSSKKSTNKGSTNKKLLWHGSRLTNWYSILSKGLKIAPPEAPTTGYMFGKGVYFSDCSSKSANYIFPSEDPGFGFMALCSVDLGNIHDMYQCCYELPQALPPGKESVCGVGKSIPSRAVKLDQDIVPLGPLIPNKTLSQVPSLLYNEFIVYDTDKVEMKYLVKVEYD